MKKGIEILEEVYFASTEKISNRYVDKLVVSKDYEYMQVSIDWDNRKICILLISRWNSDYDIRNVVDF